MPYLNAQTHFYLIEIFEQLCYIQLFWNWFCMISVVTCSLYVNTLPLLLSMISTTKSCLGNTFCLIKQANKSQVDSQLIAFTFNPMNSHKHHLLPPARRPIVIALRQNTPSICLHELEVRIDLSAPTDYRRSCNGQRGSERASRPHYGIID